MRTTAAEEDRKLEEKTRKRGRRQERILLADGGHCLWIFPLALSAHTDSHLGSNSLIGSPIAAIRSWPQYHNVNDTCPKKAVGAPGQGSGPSARPALGVASCPPPVVRGLGVALLFCS